MHGFELLKVLIDFDTQTHSSHKSHTIRKQFLSLKLKRVYYKHTTISKISREKPPNSTPKPKPHRFSHNTCCHITTQFVRDRAFAFLNGMASLKIAQTDSGSQQPIS
jgi:hypothetical protein